ncbi:Putative transcriptional regulator, ModE family [Sphingopyxis granuli]|uniref:Transcriptional regulator, ModE family n=2 Tax=Sphingopyxis granuli TaxID=267128 RepID=A0AA86GQS1_9SPHN|nr:Putative transcriptional regulator, ModE family [Sphingopyxis granuli]
MATPIAMGAISGLSCGMSGKPPFKIKIQFLCGDEIAMGPGKADLLDAIQDHGSISAAGRALGMSYRRTWLLVDVMNRCWNERLVQTVAGGSHNRGARLTDTGQQVLAAYRAIQASARASIAGPSCDRLAGMIRSEPLPAAYQTETS